jgi:threonine/homoserine/homoserine lactone efflux protein
MTFGTSGPPLLLAFLLASLVLAVTPGPGVLYIVARTLAHGRQAGLASVAGVALGNLGNALGAALGLAALLAASATAFALLKWAGVAYLIYLGLAALRVPHGALPSAPARGPDLGDVLRDGFWVALLNPKTTLFFAAFLPQFIDPAKAALAQTVTLGVTFVAIAACTDTAYVLAARGMAPWLERLPRAAVLGRRAQAAVYFGLGLFAATAGQRPVR